MMLRTIKLARYAFFSLSLSMLYLTAAWAQSGFLANISTRGKVLSGNDVMIAGFIIQGGPQTVVVSAAGPSLGNFGITDFLADPTLTLVRSSDQAVIASNDDWVAAANAAQILASGLQPSNSLEPAILMTLQPGAYTAIVSGKSGATGVALVGVFNVAPAVTTPSVAGNWHGTYTYTDLAGNQTANWVMTLSQDSSNNLTGTISCSGFGFSTGPNALTGHITGAQLSLGIASGLCQVNLNATVANNALTGTYTQSGSCGCFSNKGGSIPPPGAGPWVGTMP